MLLNIRMPMSEAVKNMYEESIFLNILDPTAWRLKQQNDVKFRKTAACLHHVSLHGATQYFYPL